MRGRIQPPIPGNFLVADIGTSFHVVQRDVARRTLLTTSCETGMTSHTKLVQVWTRQSTQDDFVLKIEIPFVSLQKAFQQKGGS